MYGAAGSTRLRSYPPRLGFQPESSSASATLVGPCFAQQHSPMRQHDNFGVKQMMGNDQEHCTSSCLADIGFQHTPTSSTETTVSMSSGLDQIRHKVEVGGKSCSRREEATVVVSNKSRIKWTQHLHHKFTECLSILGGADKATPKSILRLMGVQGLTIYHVKSHLQKYRLTRFVSDSKQVKLNNPTPLIDLEIGKQLAESFQMQLDVQMQLHEQLQVQKDLQLKIEEQGRQLKLLLEQRLKQQQQQKQPKDKNSRVSDQP